MWADKVSRAWRLCKVMLAWWKQILTIYIKHCQAPLIHLLLICYYWGLIFFFACLALLVLSEITGKISCVCSFCNLLCAPKSLIRAPVACFCSSKWNKHIHLRASLCPQISVRQHRFNSQACETLAEWTVFSWDVTWSQFPEALTASTHTSLLCQGYL